MNILFTVCGRAGSKGIKNKNLMDFLGHPLPFYTISAVDLYRKRNQTIRSDIVLNTDSKELIKLFEDQLNIKVEIINRDPLLGLDNTPKIAVIQNSLEMMEKRQTVNYNMVVDLDITAPLRTVGDIQALIDKKLNSKADSVFSVTNSRRNPYFNMVKKTEDCYERVIGSSFNARQETPLVYDINASLYAFSPDFIKSGKMLFDGKCDIILMKDTGILDLDHINDLELMEVIARYLFDNYPEFKEIFENVEDIYQRC